MEEIVEGSIIEQANQELYDWGTWSLNDGTNIGYPSQVPIGRVMKEGPGASSGGATPSIEMPDSVRRVEQAVRLLPSPDIDVIKLKYLNRGISDRDRAKMVNLSYARFRTILERAQHFVAGCLFR